MTNIGRLEKLNLRDQWQTEDKDFTPWLSENLDLLSEEINLDLELKGTNIPVGNYNADIVAQLIGEESNVVIENKLGESDHEHLGKLITYAGGLNASYVILICKKIRNEHRTAIDWLNKNSEREVGFFALEIELLRIGDSLSAPNFKVICQPDEWEKIVKSVASEKLTETKLLQQRFWEGLKENMEKEGTILKPRMPWPGGWYPFAVGRSGFSINLTANVQPKRVGCSLEILEKGNEAIEALKDKKVKIEEECGAKLEWQKLEGMKRSRIAHYRDWDIENEESWRDIYPWLKDRAETFYKVFSPLVKELEI